MNRDPRFALSQELEAKQTLFDQLRALATDDPDFFTDLLEGETNLLELIAALDASILDDETLVDGVKTALDKLQALGFFLFGLIFPSVIGAAAAELNRRAIGSGSFWSGRSFIARPPSDVLQLQVPWEKVERILPRQAVRGLVAPQSEAPISAPEPKRCGNYHDLQCRDQRFRRLLWACG